MGVVYNFLVFGISGLKNKIYRENPSTQFLISVIKFFLDDKYFDAKFLWVLCFLYKLW